MAIGVGSIVAVKTSITGSPGPSQGFASPQPPCFGVNESASTPFTVTWSNNGSRVTGIPGTSLDEITDATSPSQKLLFQVVNLTANSSPAGNSLVVAVYARSGTDVVLLKSLQTGSFMEALASAVTVQAGL
jgi:hypothetical protein